MVLTGQKPEEISDLRMKQMRQHRSQALLKRQKSEETHDQVLPRVPPPAKSTPAAPPPRELLKAKPFANTAFVAPLSPVKSQPFANTAFVAPLSPVKSSPVKAPLCQLLQQPQESEEMWIQALVKRQAADMVCGSPVRSPTKAKSSTSSPLLKRLRSQDVMSPVSPVSSSPGSPQSPVQESNELKPFSGPSGDQSAVPMAKQNVVGMSSGPCGLSPSPVAKQNYAGTSSGPSGLSPSPVVKQIEDGFGPIPVPVLPVAAPNACHQFSSARPRLEKDASHTSARLLRLEFENFGVFEKESVSLEGGSVACVVGPNSCGKSTLAHAIRFVCLCGEPRVGGTQNLVRFSDPPCESGLVTAHFASVDGGEHMLRREARSDASPGRFWVAGPTKDAAFKEVSAEEYRAYLTRDLRWEGEAVVLSQFALLEACGAGKILETLPGVFGSISGGAGASAGPLQKLLKRKSALSGSSGGAVSSSAARAEAWLARRVDEIYQELSRVPLDDRMEEWGEGGQAILRRRAGGGFSITVSQRRGAASVGCGTPLESLSDGDQDLCALAMLFALPGLRANLRDAPPAFVLLDEPDSRLDRRHAKALLRFMEGPLGPRQSVVLSLNNHGAFDGNSVAHQMEVPE